MKQNRKPKRAPKQKQAGKRETLNERVHRHLSDINSEITDDDIKSVRTGLEIRSATNPENTKEKSENQRAKENKETTTWDQLSEGYD